MKMRLVRNLLSHGRVQYLDLDINGNQLLGVNGVVSVVRAFNVPGACLKTLRLVAWDTPGPVHTILICQKNHVGMFAPVGTRVIILEIALQS